MRAQWPDSAIFRRKSQAPRRGAEHTQRVSALHSLVVAEEKVAITSKLSPDNFDKMGRRTSCS